MIQKLQRCANKFIRLAFGLSYRSSITNVMKENQIMSLEQLLQFDISRCMYQYFNNLLPKIIMQTFDRHIHIRPDRISRSMSNVYPKYCRIHLTKQSFKYKGPLAWNKLSNSLKAIKSSKSFVQNLKKFVLSVTN